MSADRRRAMLGLVAMLALFPAAALLQPSASIAQSKVPPVFTGLVKGVAVGGYDPVAYFTKGQATRGSAEFSLQHGGPTWRFATAENRDAFKADPVKYAPQFGGYCAWAVAEGYTAKGDPNAWSIVDGKLYLNYDKAVQRTWEKAARANIGRGNANWPKMTGK